MQIILLVPCSAMQCHATLPSARQLSILHLGEHGDPCVPWIRGRVRSACFQRYQTGRRLIPDTADVLYLVIVMLTKD